MVQTREGPPWMFCPIQQSVSNSLTQGATNPPPWPPAGSACLEDYTLSEFCPPSKTAESKDKAFYCSAAFSAPTGKRMSQGDGWKENIPSKVPVDLPTTPHPSGSMCLRPAGLLLQNKMFFTLLGLYTQENESEKWSEPRDQFTQTSRTEHTRNITHP